MSGKKSKTVLVYHMGGLGDMVVALPAFYAVRKRHQDAHLVLIGNPSLQESYIPSYKEVVEPLRIFDYFINYLPPKLIKIESWISILNLAIKIIKLKPQIIYYLAPRNRTLSQLKRDNFFFHHICGINQLEGFKSEYYIHSLFQALFDKEGNIVRLSKEADYLLNLVQEERENNAISDFILKIPEEFELRASKLMNEIGLEQNIPTFTIAPGSKMPAKRWPIEKFKELGERLLKIYPELRLIVIGGKEDIQMGENLCAYWGKRAKNIAGKTSFWETAVFLKKTKLYIGNDTATMHLAAMVGIPCVAIFSARDNPVRWEPYGKGHIILRKKIECEGCMLEICKDKKNACLRKIEVEEVVEAVRKIYEI